MKYIEKTEEVLIGSAMIAVIVLLTVNITLRFFFSAGITWAEEFIRYSIIYITFIGSSVCFHKGIHVGVDILMDSLNEKGKRILSLIINFLSIVFMVLLIKYGMDLVMFSRDTGQLAPAMGIKIYWFYLAIPLGALLSLIKIIFHSAQLLRTQV